MLQYICFSIFLFYFSFVYSIEKTCNDTLSNSKLYAPYSGFILTNFGSIIHVTNTYDNVVLPSEFVIFDGNYEKNVFKGESTFRLVSTLFSNFRPVWSNGVEYLYHLETDDSSATFGTWLIGTTVGVDGGVAYFKPSSFSYTPLGS